MYYPIIVIAAFAPMLNSLPIGDISGITGAVSTMVLSPLSNLGDTINKKIETHSKAFVPNFGIPTFPDSGRQYAAKEFESLTSQLDTKYSQLQNFVAGFYNPKPVVDTIQEHEKYGNDGDKFRAISTFTIGKFEGLSNFLNTAVDVPFQKVKTIGRQLTNSLNLVGGKLVGLN